MWHGGLGFAPLARNSLYNGSEFAVSQNALYFLGRYTNVYQHGSTPRPKHEGAGVLALDAKTGKVEWARQYRVGPIESTQEAPANFNPHSIGFSKDGDLLVAGKRMSEPVGDGDLFVFKLKPDGTPAK